MSGTLKFKGGTPPTTNNSWFSNLLPAIVNSGVNAVGDVGNALLAPIQTLGHGILPNIVPAQTPDQQASAERGSEIGMSGPLMPEMGAVNGNLGYIGRQVGGKAVDTGENIAKGVQDFTTDLAAQPGGLQAGRVNTDLLTGGATSNLKRDLRFSKPTTPGALKPNLNPTKPIMSQEFTPPKSGLLPSDIAETKPIVSAPVEPPVRKPISYTTTDVGKPGSVHIATDSNIESAPQLANAQKAVDNIPGKTATDKFNNWNSRMSEISNNIADYNSSHPVNVPEAQIKANIVGKVKPFIAPEGMSPAEAQVNGFITQEQANIIADDTVRQLKLQAGINTPTIGAQSDIPIDQVTKMKQSFNDIYGPLLAKRASGAPLTAAQQIQLAARDGLDGAIGTYQPNIKAMTLEQSGLYDAQPQLAKQFNTEYTASQQPKPNIIQRAEGAIKANPIGYGALALGAGTIGKDILPAITGAGSVVAGSVNKYLPAIQKAVGGQIGIGPFNLGGSNSPQGNQEGNGNSKQNIHTTSIAPTVNSTSFSTIKPNADGTYSLPKSAPTGQNTRHYTTQDEYLQGLKTLAQQYPEGDRNPYYSTAKTNLDTQFAADQKQADEVFKGNNIKNFMDNATTYNDDGNQLGQTLANMPDATTFWNGVGKAKSIKAYTDPRFASELQQISKFNDEYKSAYEAVTGKTPDDDQLLSSANSAGQALTKYNSMMQFINGTYGKYVGPYLALTSSSGTQTQTGNPTTSTTNLLPTIGSTPQNKDFTGMVGGTNPATQALPPIQ